MHSINTAQELANYQFKIHHIGHHFLAPISITSTFRARGTIRLVIHIIMCITKYGGLKKK